MRVERDFRVAKTADVLEPQAVEVRLGWWGLGAHNSRFYTKFCRARSIVPFFSPKKGTKPFNESPISKRSRTNLFGEVPGNRRPYRDRFY